MTESEMGDIQDALAVCIPQSCIPTFEQMESWTDHDEEQVRSWIDGGTRGTTPDVFLPVIAAYYAPRPSESARILNAVTEQVNEQQAVLAYRTGRSGYDD